MARIFELALVQRADRLVAQKLAEADDVGERRSKLIGDEVHEIVAQVGGAFERLVALAQRSPRPRPCRSHR